MPPQSPDYVRTTITVPRDLKRRMQSASGINWSAVACEAFEARLADLAAKTGANLMFDMPSMDDALERLRRLKNLPESSERPGDFETGLAWGRRWAMASALPHELSRLESYYERLEPQWPQLEGERGSDILKEMAAAIVNVDLASLSPRDVRTGRIPPRLREFWPVEVGLEQRPKDRLGFARGFCDGAVGFWREAKEQL